jgi:hypothetical protein
MQTATIWLVGTVGLLCSAHAWASQSAPADVHHCLNAQNRAVFQDRPCEQSGLREAKRKAPAQVAPVTGTSNVQPAQAPRPAAPRMVGSRRTV